MYVQLDTDYFNHPKTIHLISLIGPEADVYPPRLWTWAMKYAKSGVLKTPGMVETACRWKDDDGRLHKALVASGFLDEDGVTIHGWMERTGHGLQRYEEKKARGREKYRNSANFCGKNSRVEESRVDKSKEEESKADKSSPPGLLASAYIAKNRGIISYDKCYSICDFYLASIDFKAAEQAVWNSKKGEKIWEILEPLRPVNGGAMSMDEIIKTAHLNGKGAK